MSAADEFICFTPSILNVPKISTDKSDDIRQKFGY